MTVSTEVSWWKELTKKDMLEMALVLSKKALPAWNNFNLYSKLNHELKVLPANALEDMDAMFNGKLDERKLNEHFSTFITPVIHIQDGYLKFPYEVKLAFLSVFHLLKGILSESNKLAAREEFSSSISRSIDAIQISNLMGPEEITELTYKYFLLSQNA